MPKLLNVDTGQPIEVRAGAWKGASKSGGISALYDYRESLKKEWGLSGVTSDFANLVHGLYISLSGVATIFGPPATTCLGPWTKGYGDNFFLASPWRAPSVLRAPRGRGACGALATPLISPLALLRLG